MKNLARAAVCGVYHFEFADDDDVDPDVAANALEEIFFHLRAADAKEKRALADVLAELKAEALQGTRSDKEQFVEFCDTFMDDLEDE